MATKERGVLPEHLRGIERKDMHLTAEAIGPRTGQQLRMIVADEALQRCAREAVPYLVEQLARHLVQCNEMEVRAAVDHYLKDRSWVEPLVRDAVFRVVREVVTEMLMSSELAEALRSE